MSLFFSMRKGTRPLLAALALAALTSCGGGEEVPFTPTRILAFGDEASVIEASGLKYTVNAFRITDATTTPPTESTTEVDCTRNPIWIQYVAASFGLAFDRCLGTATAASGQILAQAGHKVADLPAQIAAVQGAALNELDIALMLVGMHDILELYGQYPTRSADDLLTEARTRAVTLGNTVNSLARAGPAVVVLTIPDISLSPFAISADAAAGDNSRSSLLRELVKAFNDRMSVTLINDGRLIGLVYGDLETQNNAKFPASYGLTNVTEAACRVTAPLPTCTTSTLVPNATAAGHMWADALNLGPTVQTRLGVLAQNRAISNPF